MIDIQTTEETIIETLKEVAGLKRVDSYQGDIESAMRDTLTHPAALVLYGGAQPQMTPTRDSAKGTVTVSFSIWVLGKNLRGKKEASQDVRNLLTLCREKLNGLKMKSGDLTRTLLWQGESLELAANTGVCAYEQQYVYTDFI